MGSNISPEKFGSFLAINTENLQHAEDLVFTSNNLGNEHKLIYPHADSDKCVGGIHEVVDNT
jgi:hypothetical protein